MVRKAKDLSEIEYWDEFLKSRVACWYTHNDRCQRMCFSITEFLGMTVDEYAQWVVGGEVSDRVRRVWDKGFNSWKERIDGEEG